MTGRLGVLEAVTVGLAVREAVLVLVRELVWLAVTVQLAVIV